MEKSNRATLPFRHVLHMVGNFLRKKGYKHLFNVFIPQLLKQAVQDCVVVVRTIYRVQRCVVALVTVATTDITP